MQRRNAIITMLAGMMPALSIGGQKFGEVPKPKDGIAGELTLGPISGTNNGGFLQSAQQVDPYVAFFNNNQEVAAFGWSLKTSELVVKMDGREHRISAKEIMDALEKK